MEVEKIFENFLKKDRKVLTNWLAYANIVLTSEPQLEYFEIGSDFSSFYTFHTNSHHFTLFTTKFTQNTISK